MAEDKVKKGIMTWLYAILAVVFFIMVVLIAGKAVYLKSVDPDQWLEKSATIRTMSIEALRGDIFSSDGRILATSMPSYEVHWDLTVQGLKNDSLFLKNVDTLSICMSKLFKDLTPKQYSDMFRKAFAEKKSYFKLRDKATLSQVNMMKKFPIFSKGRYVGGFISTLRYIRERPHKGLATRTIGYFSKDNDPRVGMEGCFNAKLAGHPGLKLCEKTGSGIWLPVNPYDDENEVEPEDGYDIVSTLDVTIQDIAEKCLENQLRKCNAKYGTAIVMEVKTGKIRALTNRDVLPDGKMVETFNYGVGTASEPGSTFKLASIIAVLEETNMSIDKTINLGDGTFMGIKDDHPIGEEVTLREIFEKSSNVGVAKIAHETFNDNREDFVSRIKSLNFGQVNTGIELYGEPVSNVKNAKEFDRTTLPYMSIGYQVLVTPLQTLTLYNAVANNGVMVRPHVLESVKFHGETIETYTPEIIKASICSKETIAKVKELLEGVVERGTAKNIKSDNYKIAGKTGTAQVAIGKEGYKDEQGNTYYLASFAGYFPAENPKYSCIVVIHSSSKFSYYGSAVAAPVFKSIADKLYSIDRELHTGRNFDLASKENNLQPPITKGGDREILDRLFSTFNITINNVDKTSSAFVTAETKSEVVEIEPVVTKRGYMPDVKGMGLRDAMFLLKKYKLDVSVVGRGCVRKQSINPGTLVKSGTKVTIELG